MMGCNNFSVRARFTHTTSLFLYSAPKKYLFAPTTKHNGAQKSKKAKTNRTQSVKTRDASGAHIPERLKV